MFNTYIIIAYLDLIPFLSPQNLETSEKCQYNMKFPMEMLFCIVLLYLALSLSQYGVNNFSPDKSSVRS